MSSTYGNHYKVSLFGGADEKPLGVVIEGLPAGFKPDMTALQNAVGNFKIAAGLREDVCTGAPLYALFPSPDSPKLKEEVPQDTIRPGFADLGEYKKYGGFFGQFAPENMLSPLLFAGTLAQDVLESKKIHLLSHILSVGEATDDDFETVSMPANIISELKSSAFPVLDKRKEMLMKLCIAKAQTAEDTIGGKIEAMAMGLPAGIGETVFGGLQSKVAAMMFSLPRVVGVEFGKGTNASKMRGSEYNDTPYVDTILGEIMTKTNHCGGVCGGLSNGMPLTLTVSFAPSPAIGFSQPTVHRSERHDTTLPPFVNPTTCDIDKMCRLVQAALALTIIDIL